MELVFAAIGAVLIPILLWLFSPEPVREWWRRCVMHQRNVDRALSIKPLEKRYWFGGNEERASYETNTEFWYEFTLLLTAKSDTVAIVGLKAIYHAEEGRIACLSEAPNILVNEKAPSLDGNWELFGSPITFRRGETLKVEFSRKMKPNSPDEYAIAYKNGYYLGALQFSSTDSPAIEIYEFRVQYKNDGTADLLDQQVHPANDGRTHDSSTSRRIGVRS